MTGSITHVRAHHLSLALDDQTVIELADHTSILIRASLVRAKLNLLVRSVSSRLRVLEVAANNLIPSHHDIRTLGWPASIIPTVALCDLSPLDVRLKHGVQLLSLQADRFDQGMPVAAVGHVAGSRLLTRAIRVARAMALGLAEAAAKAISAERDIATALARVLAHAKLCVRGHAQVRRILMTVEVRVEDLLDGDLGKDLQVHQG